MNIEARQNWKAFRDFLIVALGTGAIASLSYVGDNIGDLGLTPTQISIASPIIAAASLWVHRFVRKG